MHIFMLQTDAFGQKSALFMPNGWLKIFFQKPETCLNLDCG
jgi:hypothetical protein